MRPSSEFPRRESSPGSEGRVSGRGGAKRSDATRHRHEFDYGRLDIKHRLGSNRFAKITIIFQHPAHKTSMLEIVRQANPNMHHKWSARSEVDYFAPI